MVELAESGTILLELATVFCSFLTHCVCPLSNPAPPTAEIIAIGDELISGQRVDTNSQWLSQQLGDLGIRTRFHTTVGDDLDANIQAFRNAAMRSQIVVCTGGLGPTADDLTRTCIARAFDRELVLDQASLDRIRQMFASRGRDMPAQNRVQAMFPDGSRAIRNPHGTAPGIDFTTDDNCRIFALPGVPAEMKEMFHGTVQDALQEQYGSLLKPVFHHEIKCFGTGESALEAMLPDLIRRGRQPTVGITVSQATITLRISAQASDASQFQSMIEPTVRTIRASLGNLVFGEGDVDLHHAVHRLLVAQRKSVAVSEWGTAGLIARWLHDMDQPDTAIAPHAHTAFAGGFVINRAEIVAGTGFDRSSEELVRQMAEQARAQACADFGLAVGRFPESKADAKSELHLALATDAGVIVEPRRLAGHPAIRSSLAAKQALDLLRQHLTENG